ncbi:MAG: uracil-DNA glycosylase family protein, partial [Candidatus Heimdallarchaeaceae archaeon]
MLKELQELNKEIRSCKNCSLWESRTKAVCGMGHHNSKLMLIAQAPGEKEDRDGTMFIGSSGKVLDELLKHAKIKREEMYM